MTDETAIYEKQDIKITNLRAVFGEKTYSVSNITSVETKRTDPGGCLPISLIIGGILAIIIGISNFQENQGWLVMGVIALGLFYFVNKEAKPTWSVSLTTASGEVKAYSSGNQEAIKEIVASLNDAIIKKG